MLSTSIYWCEAVASQSCLFVPSVCIDRSLPEPLEESNSLSSFSNFLVVPILRKLCLWTKNWIITLLFSRVFLTENCGSLLTWHYLGHFLSVSKWVFSSPDDQMNSSIFIFSWKRRQERHVLWVHFSVGESKEGHCISTFVYKVEAVKVDFYK